LSLARQNPQCERSENEMKTVIAFLVAPAVIPAAFMPLYAIHVAIFGTIGIAEAFRRFTTNVFAMGIPAVYFTAVMGAIPLYFLLRRFKRLGFISISLSACALGLLWSPFVSKVFLVSPLQNPFLFVVPPLAGGLVFWLIWKTNRKEESPNQALHGTVGGRADASPSVP
jgi:hypothetical protein